MEYHAIPQIVIGVVILLFGRKIFWFFVGAIGFITGIHLATEYFHGQSPWLALLVGVVLGVLGAVLAVFLQRAVVALAGFVAGGYLAVSLLGLFVSADSGFAWIPFLIGGVVGAILISLLFDWAVIILSSLSGAMMIAQAVPVDSTIRTVAFLVLLLFGVIVQARQIKK